MEMSIDEAIDIMERYEMYGIGAQKDGRNKAIEIMRKHQKIQEIYQWAKDRSYLVETDDIMNKLKEVVEDGKN